MNSLNTLSKFHKIANFNKVNNLISQITEWSVLNTGLTNDHKIGRPTKYANSYNFHFALTGGSQKILRYNIDTGFSSSSANPNPNRAADEIRDYTNLTNVQGDGTIFASIRTLNSTVSTFRIQKSTDGYSYPIDNDIFETRANSLEDLYKVNINTYYFTVVYHDGRGSFNYALNNGIAFGSLRYEGAISLFNNDCKDVVYDGTNFFLFGGSGTTARIATVNKSSLTSSVSAWTNIFNSFGQGISKAYIAEIYLNYSKPSWLPSDYYLVVESSYTKIFLIGGANGKIAKSTDGGSTWVNSSTQPFSSNDTVIGFASGNIAIFAVTNTGKIAKSIDAGVNWTLVSVGLTPSSLSFAQSTISPDGLHKIYIGGSNAFLASWNYEKITS